MAKLLPPFLVYSLAFSCLLLHNISSNSNGLKLEMIHPNSQESSHFQRIQRLTSLSTHRANQLLTTSFQTASTPRPLIDMQDFNYIIKISIGTFNAINPPFKDYYLIMDTGSSFTWMQCEGCTTCFKQNPAPFPKNRSTSFHPIRDGANRLSAYSLAYLDGSKTSGIIATETLHLNSKNGIRRVAGFVFGCGLVNNMSFGFKNNRIAGIVGLGWGDYSFLAQIKESKGRFSYCLPVVTNARPKTTYLRLGDDVGQGRQRASSTTLKRVGSNGSYHVGLQGISINKKRLNISSSVFEGRTGGCIIDSGTPYSRIISPAYLKLRQGLEEHFSRDKNLKMTGGIAGLGLCYDRATPQGFKNLPEITFHFEGPKGDMIIRPEGGFEVGKRFKLFKFREYFCLAMMPSTIKSIIGSHQQTNQRIVYDTQQGRLMFYPEDCSRSS